MIELSRSKGPPVAPDEGLGFDTLAAFSAPLPDLPGPLTEDLEYKIYRI